MKMGEGTEGSWRLNEGGRRKLEVRKKRMMRGKEDENAEKEQNKKVGSSWRLKIGGRRKLEVRRE
jgi:hypothetical protein